MSKEEIKYSKECEYCPGYRYDGFMDDTFYCPKYTGVWDEFKLSRVCYMAKHEEEASASSTHKEVVNMNNKTKLVCPDCGHEVREILQYVNEKQVYQCEYCDYSKTIEQWLHQSIRTNKICANEEASASSPISEHDRRIVQAAKELKEAMSSNSQAPAPSYNFEWESELDCLLAPPQEERQSSPSSTDEEVTIVSYQGFNFKKKQPIEEVVTVVKMDRQEFHSKTIFPQDFPVPVVCAEFCDVHKNCHLRQIGFDDLCKSSHRFGKLVHRVDLKWSAWHDFRTRLPKTQFVKSTRTGSAPEIALAHWGSPDAQMDDDGTYGDEYESPVQQAREFGDKDAVRFIPAYIFAPGKPEWKYMVAFDKQGFPYRKMVKYPSIRPIACKVELWNGYVVPTGKAASSLKITTRADKKRMRAYSAIKKELTQYVGDERAGKMAGQRVAAMATC